VILFGFKRAGKRIRAVGKRLEANLPVKRGILWEEPAQFNRSGDHDERSCAGS
jgi:hypothetical protein